MREQDQLIAFVGACEKEYILDQDDVRVLASTSSVDWEAADEVAERCGVEPRVIKLLVEYGFLLGDDDDASERPGAQVLSSWHPDALYYHQRVKWQGHDAKLPADGEHEDESRSASERFFAMLAERQGPIPGHFHARSGAPERLNLDLGSYPGTLANALENRRTTRLFDTSVPLGRGVFSTVLRHVFGCQGTAHLSEQVTALKKTSPSGGAMHPVEVYPLVLRAEGVEPGLYHYHVGDHALEPLEQFTEDEGRELVRKFTAGQGYYATAHVLFLYTGRFERSFWKYRRNPRAYKVVQLDLGHLSQTLYLVCADLGLGAFFTAACNEVDIEQALGIDGIAEGALGVGGMGIPAPDAEVMGFKSERYTPRGKKGSE